MSEAGNHDKKHRPFPQKLIDWEKQPGARISDADAEFINAMRAARAAGVGYGFMQQIVEWEWQEQDPLSARSHVATPGIPPLGSTASTPESEADAKKFLDHLLCKPVDGVTYAEVHRLLWLALALQEKAARPSAIAPHLDTVRLDFIERMGRNANWTARHSSTGRGYRLHNDKDGTALSARNAIDEAMRRAKGTE